MTTSAPKPMTMKFCWRYIDFLHLYKGTSESELRELYNTLGDGALLDQCSIDLYQELEAEAKKRGMKSKDVERELEARAAAAGLPSATGIAPYGLPLYTSSSSWGPAPQASAGPARNPFVNTLGDDSDDLPPEEMEGSQIGRPKGDAIAAAAWDRAAAFVRALQVHQIRPDSSMRCGRPPGMFIMRARDGNGYQVDLSNVHRATARGLAEAAGAKERPGWTPPPLPFGPPERQHPGTTTFVFPIGRVTSVHGSTVRTPLVVTGPRLLLSLIDR